MNYGKKSLIKLNDINVNFLRIIPDCMDAFDYHKYPNLVRTQNEIISDPNYLVRIFLER